MLQICKDYLNRSFFRFTQGLLSAAGFGMFIAGSVWTFRIYEPEYYDTSSANYCHKTVYLFSFVNLVLGYAIIGLGLIIGLCFLGYVSCYD